MNKQLKNVSQRAFTLIELAIVVTVIGLAMALVGIRLGTFAFWHEEGFIRRLSETMTFLHHQAVADQAFYILRFKLDQEKAAYSVGVINTAEEADAELIRLASDAGNLTLELAAFLSPALSRSSSIIPPPSMPSLADETPFPTGAYIEDIRTMRGKQLGKDGGEAYVLFSPRGFSEFAVLHLRLSRGKPVTILVNPFTGLTEIYREYRDFEWTYGRKHGGQET